MSIEEIKMPGTLPGMLVWIDIDRRSDGWYYGYHLGLGAPAMNWDSGDSFTDGIGHPIDFGPHSLRLDALHHASQAMLKELSKLGLNVPSHEKRRKLIAAWLNKIAPAQMSLF